MQVGFCDLVERFISLLYVRNEISRYIALSNPLKISKYYLKNIYGTKSYNFQN